MELDEKEIGETLADWLVDRRGLRPDMAKVLQLCDTCKKLAKRQREYHRRPATLDEYMPRPEESSFPPASETPASSFPQPATLALRGPEGQPLQLEDTHDLSEIGSFQDQGNEYGASGR